MCGDNRRGSSKCTVSYFCSCLKRRACERSGQGPHGISRSRLSVNKLCCAWTLMHHAIFAKMASTCSS
jgi:hypothetical protein